MNTIHYKAIQCLQHCHFFPGSFDKRFARNMAQLGPYDLLTPRQQAQVERMAVRYRKQLARLGYTPPPELIEPYFERQRTEKTPDDIKYHWVPELKQSLTASPQLNLLGENFNE